MDAVRRELQPAWGETEMSELTQAALLSPEPLPAPEQIGAYTIQHTEQRVRAVDARGRLCRSIEVTRHCRRSQALAIVRAAVLTWTGGTP